MKYLLGTCLFLMLLLGACSEDYAFCTEACEEAGYKGLEGSPLYNFPFGPVADCECVLKVRLESIPKQ